MWTQDPVQSGQPCHTFPGIPSTQILDGSRMKGHIPQTATEQTTWTSPSGRGSSSIFQWVAYDICREQEKMELMCLETDKFPGQISSPNSESQS